MSIVKLHDSDRTTTKISSHTHHLHLQGAAFSLEESGCVAEALEPFFAVEQSASGVAYLSTFYCCIANKEKCVVCVWVDVL